MSLHPRISIAAANLAADVVCAELNNGYWRFYDGVQPATVDTPITTQNQLCELRWNAVAFAPAVNGVASSNDVTPDPSAAGSGQATWFRAFKSDGVTPVFDGSIGTSGANLNLNSANIFVGAPVSVGTPTNPAYTYTQRGLT